MFNGNIVITTDTNVINRALYEDSAKVLYLCDEDISSNGSIQLGYKVVKSSILLPPYEAVCAMIDNDPALFLQLYTNYLGSPDLDIFITMIMKILMDDQNIILYPGRDEAEMAFIPILSQYFMNYFGVAIGNIYERSMFNFAAVPTILNKMYLYELIDYNEFFILYPVAAPIIPDIVPKLIQEMNPYVSEPSMPVYLKYFTDYLYSVKQNSNNPLRTVIARGVNM